MNPNLIFRALSNGFNHPKLHHPIWRFLQSSLFSSASQSRKTLLVNPQTVGNLQRPLPTSRSPLSLDHHHRPHPRVRCPLHLHFNPDFISHLEVFRLDACNRSRRRSLEQRNRTFCSWYRFHLLDCNLLLMGRTCHCLVGQFYPSFLQESSNIKRTFNKPEKILHAHFFSHNSDDSLHLSFNLNFNLQCFIWFWR